jgi:hypothetical protein
MLEVSDEDRFLGLQRFETGSGVPASAPQRSALEGYCLENWGDTFDVLGSSPVGIRFWESHFTHNGTKGCTHGFSQRPCPLLRYAA